MDKQYYVYSYRDSDNDEVVYIGHGCKGRAWNSDYTTMTIWRTLNDN